MTELYSIDDPQQIISPGLVVFEELVRANLAKMLRIAGSAERLRPHCKTHKMIDVTRMQVALGIEKHKCATFAEAEMLAEGGAKDIFLAYNVVGPNIARAVKFRQRYPHIQFAVTADHSEPIRQLSAAMSAAGLSISVFLDIDSGLRRTGVEAGPEAHALYSQITNSPGLKCAGLHLYDGQNHQSDVAARRAAVQQCWQKAAKLRDALQALGLDVAVIVAGGTGSFELFAEIDDAAIELSPGTCVFHDAGYAQLFSEMDFQAAALILTRVVSRPGKDLVTFDLGTKALASDPPAGQRMRFPHIDDAVEVLQNEEHLVIRTQYAQQFSPGDIAVAIPSHICPTSALYSHATLIKSAKVAGRWPVTARDRALSI